MQNMPKESSSKLEALQEDNFRQEYDHEEKKVTIQNPPLFKDEIRMT